MDLDTDAGMNALLLRNEAEAAYDDYSVAGSGSTTPGQARRDRCEEPGGRGVRQPLPAFPAEVAGGPRQDACPNGYLVGGTASCLLRGLNLRGGQAAAARGRSLATPPGLRLQPTSQNRPYDQERNLRGPWNPARPGRQPRSQARPELKTTVSHSLSRTEYDHETSRLKRPALTARS
jgi:hypothetical protein